MPRPTTPSLDRWRTELAGRVRTTTDLDDLWWSACAEIEALELARDRLPGLAAQRRQDAKDQLWWHDFGHLTA